MDRNDTDDIVLDDGRCPVCYSELVEIQEQEEPRLVCPECDVEW